MRPSVVVFSMLLVLSLMLISSIGTAQPREHQRDGALSTAASSPNRVVPEPLWTDAPKTRPRADLALRQEAFAQIAAQQSPAIVNIEVGLAPSARYPKLEAVGQGTGFFIHAEGYIVTNAHVVGPAREIRITTSDRRVYAAEIVGADPETDIALLRVIAPPGARSAVRFPVLSFADSEDVLPGEWVVAIGNPFGLNHTVTAGIVSAVGRRDMVTALQLGYADFIQIDAAINFGNSGGPLLNMQGHVIGMNTAIQAGNDIGFAIPSAMIREVLPQLAKGEIRRAWAGMSFEDLSVDDALTLESGRRGARVVRIAKNSPAEAAGFRVGDIVLQFEGSRVEDGAQLNWWIARSPLESHRRFGILRDGKPLELSAQLRQAPEAAHGVKPHAPTVHQAPAGPRALGVAVENLDDEGRARLTGGAAGVLVVWIEPDSAAALAGLQVGDVITHVGDDAVATAAEFLAKGTAAQELRRVGVRAIRGRSQIFLFLQRAK